MASKPISLTWFALAALSLAACAQASTSDAVDGSVQTVDGGSPEETPDAELNDPCDAVTCFEGVSCSDGLCSDCPTGTEGDGISCSDVDACVATPCADNVVCTDLPAPDTGFECGECPAGFTGNGVICTDIDSCSGSPCFPGVACSDAAPPEVGFTCGDCPTGFEGDGLSCNDIDGCAGSPCFAGVSCTDQTAPNTGFICGACPSGLTGDGITCSSVCDPTQAASCGGVISASNTSTGSADLVDDWACTVVNHEGFEIVYTFVPQGTGIATASLTGLSADLDLMVIEDTTAPGTCDALDDTRCIANGYSGKAGTQSEEVRWNATAGSTYYIIVDAFQNATSNFNLEITTSNDDILLNEIAYGDDDFVELKNFGACNKDVGGLSILHLASLDTEAESFTFANNTTVAPGQVVRRMESGSTPFAANEIDSGINIPDLPDGAGFTALCNGTCNTTNCSNLLDYVERKDGTTLPTGPSCANFSPAPIESAAESGERSLNRTAFEGAALSNDFKASDWSFGSTTRD